MFRRRFHEVDDAQVEAKIGQLRSALGSLSGCSLKFCTDACLMRYLVARNWNVNQAHKMLVETLRWRLEFKPEEIRWHEVAREAETGKVYRANFHDREGRTVLIMKAGIKNTSSLDDNVRHLVYLLENSILALPKGQEKMSWLIDFNGFSINTSVPIKTARDIVSILQNHYPERLAIIVMYNPPRIFQAFWKVVSYFVDKESSQKIKFVYPNNKESVELMKTFFDAENLPSEFGGRATLNYDHPEFSKLMIREDVETAKFWETEECSQGH